MPTILIAGANRGLGLALAREYAGSRWSVIGTSRQPRMAKDLRALKAVDVAQLDVTSMASISRLARRLRDRPIDVLLCNAGALGGASQLGHVDAAEFLALMQTNALGPLRLAEALLPQIAAGRQRKIIAISSRMGSIGSGIDENGQYAYRCSKAALNMVMATMAFDLRAHRVTTAVLHPGWIKTDMGGALAEIPAADSAHGIRRVIASLRRRDSGGFFTWLGEPIPW